LAYTLIIAVDRVNGDPNYASYRDCKCLRQPVQELLQVSGVDLFNGGGLEELQSFTNIFQITKFLFIAVGIPIDSFSVEIPFRSRNCTCYIIRTVVTIHILKLQWPRSMYVTRVTLYITTHINVTKLAPCVLPRLPVPKFSLGIVIHATGVLLM
jgi:hypothetical protein